MGVATTSDPYGTEPQAPNKKLAHWLYLLGYLDFFSKFPAHLEVLSSRYNAFTALYCQCFEYNNKTSQPLMFQSSSFTRMHQAVV